MEPPLWPVADVSHFCRLERLVKSCVRLVVSRSCTLEELETTKGLDSLENLTCGTNIKVSGGSNQVTQATSVWRFAFAVESR